MKDVKGSRFIPIELKIANRFVDKYHRHNKPVRGHKFSIGLMLEGELIGVGIAGRPVARLLDNGKTIEILRICVPEGYKNGCSKLYARMRQIAQLMGYEKVITYTLKDEAQSSLKAINAKPVSEIAPQGWNRPNRARKTQSVYAREKIRWEL